MTEREKQLARREGFINAHRLASPPHVDGSCSFCSGDRCFRCEELAARLYPLPKIERPRVVTVSDDVQMRLDAEFYLEERWSGRDWTRITLYAYSDPKTRQALAELLASPTEWIEDDVSLLRDGGL